MGQIATTTHASPFIYPSTTLLDRNPLNGYLFAMVKASTANTYEIWRSTDAGTTWTMHLSIVRANVAEIGSLFIANDDHLYWCYRTNESSQDRIWVRRARLTNPIWGPEYMISGLANGGVAGSAHTGMDLWTVGTGPYGTLVPVAIGTILGGNHGVTMAGAQYFSDGTGRASTAMFAGTRQWLQTGSGRITPSLDVEHSGDDKTANVAHIWLAFGRTALRLVKLAWSSGRWIGPTSPITVRSGLNAHDSIAGRWDGAQWLMVIQDPSATDRVLLCERNRANSLTTARQSPVHPTGVVRNCSITYNVINRDARIYAVGTSSAVLHFVDYIRATNTWTSWAQVTTTPVLGANVDNWGVRRGSSGNAKHSAYAAHSGAPNVLFHYAQSLTYAPNIPTWVAPTNGRAGDVAVALPLDWAFSDPDPGDTQSAWALSRTIGASTGWFRASDSSWQGTEQKNVGATTAVTLAAGWALATDGPYTYKVKVWDSADTASLYSDGLVVIPSAKVNPTIDSPTAAQVITTDTVTVIWTVAEQTQYRLRLNVTAGAQVYDSGWVTSVDTTQVIPVTLTDLTSYTITLETRNNEGLASDAVTRQFSVDFIEPAIPSLVATPMPSLGVIRVVITNPVPGGGQPEIASQDLFRRIVGDTTDGIRVAAGVASGATVDDWRAVSGISYEYRVLARGVNGTSVFSAWTP